jgi:hypothetical protein
VADKTVLNKVKLKKPKISSFRSCPEVEEMMEVFQVWIGAVSNLG